MRFSELLDAATASALQIAWLSAELEPVSEPGRRAAARIAPFRPGEEPEARESARRITEFSQRFDAKRIDAMRDALRIAPDPLPAVSRAAMGDALEDAHLLELLRFLDAVERIAGVMGAGAPEFLDEGTRAVSAAMQQGRAGKFGFYLADSYDPQLATARQAADRAQADYDSARGRLAQRVAAALGREEIAGTEFIVMRDCVESLPEGVRVVREAPTYYLCELELDEAALESLRKRDAASEAVAQAEERVRVRLSSVVRERVQPLEALIERIGDLDVLLARARFTQEYECAAAEICEAPVLAFSNARFLPLEAELLTQGRRYEPISIELRDVAVLTGPNMGGKSVALRTCGFVALLAAFGIPVPARSARTALFDDIAWLGIGAAQEVDGLLSSFAREVVRLKELLERDSARMLVLVDEFARTTTPHEGKALLVALVRALRRRNRLAFIATHLAGIATDAQVRHFAVRGLRDVPAAPASGDLNEALAALADSMDYSVVEVAEGQERHADAIALAQLLGLDEDLIAEAKEQVWTR